MTVRPLKLKDIPILKAMAAKAGFPYPELGTASNLEAVRVLADDDDRPIMAAAVERILQVYLWCGDLENPLAKVHAVRLLQEDLMCVMKQRGYNSCEAFIPPALAERFGRRLEKTFGWVRNWQSWSRSF